MAQIGVPDRFRILTPAKEPVPVKPVPEKPTPSPEREKEKVSG